MPFLPVIVRNLQSYVNTPDAFLLVNSGKSNPSGNLFRIVAKVPS